MFIRSLGGSVPEVANTAGEAGDRLLGARSATGDLPVQEGQIPRPRLNYIDAAKGVAVILVVLWHAVSDRMLIFEALTFLRMPLFFFAAGLFSQRGLDARWREFIPVRVGQIFWLYCLWVPIVYYATTGLRETVQLDLSLPEILRPLEMFTEPPRTLWFLYGLGLMYLGAKIVRPLPWRLVIATSLAGYVAVVDGASVPENDLLEMLCKVVVLAPFFLIASYHSKVVRLVVENRAAWGIVGLVAYMIFAVCIVVFKEQGNPFATFTASAIGIISLLMVLCRHSTSSVVRVLNKVGSRSLFIFVLHRIPLFYYTELLEFFGLQDNEPALFIGAFLIVALCWAAGEYVLSRHARWTMEAPWLTKRRVATATA